MSSVPYEPNDIWILYDDDDGQWKWSAAISAADVGDVGSDHTR